jgi:hypothetical protein
VHGKFKQLVSCWTSHGLCARVISFQLFAVPSPINGRFAMSGAGTAAYRFGRLVNVPEYSMSTGFLRDRSRQFLFSVLVAGSLSFPTVTIAGAADAQIDVVVDQAKLVKLPEHVATIVVGNPLIADVTLQEGGMMVVTGKGYGATNVIALDRRGSVLIDRAIQVEGPSDKLVTVYRGVDRETYSCTPTCQRRITLGDGTTYFSTTLAQAGNFSSVATGNARASATNAVAAPRE